MIEEQDPQMEWASVLNKEKSVAATRLCGSQKRR